MLHTTGVAVAALCASALGLAAIAWAVYGRREEPGMLAFSIGSGTLSVLALAIATVLSLEVLGVLEHAATTSDFMPIGTVGYLVAIPWLVFVLQYTGHGDLVTRRRVGWLAAFSAVHAIFMSAYQLVVPAGQMFPESFESMTVMVVFSASFLTLLTMIGFYAIGALLLLQTTYAYSHMSTLMGTLLAVPALSMIPLWTYLPQIGLGYGRAAAGLTAGTGFLVTTCCFGVVVLRDDAFGSTSVAAGPVGRETILAQQSTAVFTLDTEHRIVEVNDAARETFGLSEEPLGEPVEDVLGATVEELTTDATLSVRTVDDLWSETTVFLDTADGRRRFDTEVTTLTDGQGRNLGLVVDLEDVTERALREQRIGILNRVLRHNLRNKLSIVRGHAEMVPEAEGDLEEYADAIEAAATDLLALGERARDVERVLAVDEQGTAPVGEVAESVIESMRRTCDETAFETRVDGDYEVTTTRDALEYVLTELCENAAKHNDAANPRVTIRGEREGDWAAIDVVDNGPALSQQELVAIRDETESPLQHGSGLGLWSVRWIVTAFGGELDVTDNEPRGTVVTIRLPMAGSGAFEGDADAQLSADEFAAPVEQ